MDILFKYFHNLSDAQIQRFSRLEALYVEWNSRINVISRKDIDALYERHVLHALGIAMVTQFKTGTKVLDIGTGGGFPGIPLAIMFPDSHFTLVDAIGKKIKVVQAVAEELHLENVDAYHQRGEKIKGQFDFVVSRAVTAMPNFVKWTQGKISAIDKNDLPNGILYLKGGDLREELSFFPNAQTFNLSNYFEEEFFETKKVVHLPL